MNFLFILFTMLHMHNMKSNFYITSVHINKSIKISPTKNHPPQGGWTAENAPGFGVTCWATTQCLNQAFGVPPNTSNGQMFTCPDGSISQGTCGDPKVGGR